MGQKGELLGHNLFVYCKNNPANMHDYAGFKPAFDSVENQTDYYDWLYSRKARAVATAKPKKGSATITSQGNGTPTPSGTYSIGGSASACLWICANIIIQLNVDNDFKHFSVTTTAAARTGSPSIAVGGVFSITNAKGIRKLEGDGIATGLSASGGPIIIGVGGDYLSQLDYIYNGGSLFVGFKAEPFVEGNVNWGKTIRISGN